MITLDQLQVLSALHETGSVTGAARRLHRAQSAVSYAIRNLEEGLGLTLVDRSGYRAGLTTHGSAVLERGEEILALGEDLVNMAGELRGGVEPELILLVDGVLPIGGLMPVLERLTWIGTATRISLRLEILGALGHALRNHRPDLALTVSGMAPLPQGYIWEPLGQMVLLPVVSPNHPLARHPTPIPLAVLREHIHLVVTSSPEYRTPVDSGLVGARHRWNFPDFHSRLEGLLAGLGFAWMPTYMVEGPVSRGALRPLVLEHGNLHRGEVGLMFRHRPPLGSTGRRVLDLLRSLGEFPPTPSPDLLRPYDFPRVGE